MPRGKGLGEGWSGRMGKMLVKRHKFPVIRITSSGDGIYSMVIIAKNTVLYT